MDKENIINCSDVGTDISATSIRTSGSTNSIASKQIKSLNSKDDVNLWSCAKFVTTKRLNSSQIMEREKKTFAHLLSLLPTFFQDMWDFEVHFSNNMYSAETNQMERSDQLSVEKAKVLTLSDIGQQVIFYARKGAIQKLVVLLAEQSAERLSSILKTKDRTQQGSALNWAATEGNFNCVLALLKSGAPVDLADRRGGTALSYAAAKGYQKIVHALVDAGAQVDRQDAHRSNAMHYAAGFGHHHVLQILLQAGADHSLADDKGLVPLHWAAKQGHAQAVESLCRYGADVTLLTPKGRTPLSLACASGHTRCARILCFYSMWMLEKADNRGVTPLSFCASLGHYNCAELLLNLGADPNHEDNSMISALSWAASHNRAVCAELLIRHGADIDSVDRSGVSPLSWAASKGHPEIVSLLLRCQATVDLSDVRGMTPLMWSCTHGRKHNVKLLLAAGADPNIADKKHRSNSLHEAAFRNDAGIVKMLLECSRLTGKNARNRKGKTARSLTTDAKCRSLFDE